MQTFFSLSQINFITYFIIIFLTMFLLKKIEFVTDNKLTIEYFLSFFILYNIILLFVSLFFNILNSNFDLILYSTNPNAGQGQDPVSWWPSGIAQSWGIIGAAIATYRTVPGTPRVRAVAAFSTIGVTVPAAVFTMAVENPNGFNRLMYSWIEYKRTGSRPSNIPTNINSDTIVENFESNSNTKVDDHISKLINDNSSQNDWINDILNNYSLDSLFKKIVSNFELVNLEGYFDEIYGFIWFSQVLLLIISISLLILFIIYFIINILMLNKDKLLKKFNISNKNKIIQFYIKYQVILGNISLYVLPLLIIIGLFELIYILNYLITHPLPIESLDTNIHTYISKK